MDGRGGHRHHRRSETGNPFTDLENMLPAGNDEVENADFLLATVLSSLCPKALKEVVRRRISSAARAWMQVQGSNLGVCGGEFRLS